MPTPICAAVEKVQQIVRVQIHSIFEGVHSIKLGNSFVRLFEIDGLQNLKYPVIYLRYTFENSYHMKKVIRKENSELIKIRFVYLDSLLMILTRLKIQTTKSLGRHTKLGQFGGSYFWSCWHHWPRLLSLTWWLSCVSLRDPPPGLFVKASPCSRWLSCSSMQPLGTLPHR